MDQTEELGYIMRIKGGDPAPFVYLVDHYKHMAYTLAFRVLRDEDDAKDCAQEGFIKAYQQIKKFEGKSKFSTWLYTIVYRTALSKSKDNKLFFIPIEKFRESAGRDHDHYDQLEVTDEKLVIRKCIDRLGEPDSLLVTLYYLNENSIDEIHEITGLATTNIKIRLFRARKRLEKELKVLLDRHSQGEKRNAQ